jgi:hypothetical protein
MLKVDLVKRVQDPNRSEIEIIFVDNCGDIALKIRMYDKDANEMAEMIKNTKSKKEK